jgi:hypothetical protein
MSTAFWRVIFECGGAMCIVAGAYLLLLLRTWPRVFLRRYPDAVQKAVPPLSKRERALGFVVSLPFLVSLLAFPAWASYRIAGEANAEYSGMFLAAFFTWMMFNLFDLIVVDEFVIGVLRPSWLILKGAEQVPMAFDHTEHAVAFVKGTLGGIVVSALVAGVAYSF